MNGQDLIEAIEMHRQHRNLRAIGPLEARARMILRPYAAPQNAGSQRPILLHQFPSLTQHTPTPGSQLLPPGSRLFIVGMLPDTGWAYLSSQAGGRHVQGWAHLGPDVVAAPPPPMPISGGPMPYMPASFGRAVPNYGSGSAGRAAATASWTMSRKPSFTARPAGPTSSRSNALPEARPIPQLPPAHSTMQYPAPGVPTDAMLYADKKKG